MAASDFERIALSDGTISAAEFAEMENRYISCLEAGGLTSDGFNPDGSLGFGFRPDVGSKKANTIADRCSESSGSNTVGSLYFAMHRNPQNLDEATIVAACLAGEEGRSRVATMRAITTGTLPEHDVSLFLTLTWARRH